MRVEPAEKIRKAHELHMALRKVILRVSRIVAIVVAFLSTFALFVKILFF
ncbi:hypothetical protein [Mucilaginibacter ginkgonis]|uniref:Uncharacterized protein n=1 Tax=Mucilaginibacter ginkgonis TaxID=2682091 RepID=A0A6I4I1U2_9SPHI|nr:hypothetical protein [Mucilaginibacter ginkgonis]QQL50881.1 hypothetical protein GO620_005335 [Mucilaginibacter ginkgonis]